MGKKIYTDEEIIQALEKTGGVQSQAATIVGCDRDTIANRAKESEAIRAAIDAGLEDLADKSQTVIRDTVELSEDEKLRADTAKWVLARLRKGIWSERQELTGADGAPVFNVIVQKDGGC